MLRNRKFLFGLGTGIMIGAILVQLSFIGSTASPSVPLEPSASPAAATLGEATPTAAAEEATAAATLSPADLDQAAKEQGRVVLSEKEYAQLKQPVASPAPSSEPGSDKRFLYIYKGMNADSVTEYMYQAGVIRDRATFRERLREKDLNHKIVANLYQFGLDSDVDTVVAKLTGAK